MNLAEIIAFLNKNKPLVQKIYSSQWLINFELRIPGKSLNLYFSRGGLSKGIAFCETKLPTTIRLKDTLVEFLRSHILNHRLSEMQVVSTDLASSYIVLKFLHSTCEYSCALGWFENRLLVETGPVFTHILQKQLDYFSVFSPMDIMEREVRLVKSGGRPKELKSKELKLRRKIEHIESDLAQMRWGTQLSPVLAEMDLGQLKDISSGKFTLKLNARFNHHQNMNLAFTRIKKWKALIPMMEERLLETKKLLNKKSIAVSYSSIARPHPCHLYLKTAKSESSGVANKIQLPDVNSAILLRELLGYSCAMGKNAQGNDFLRNTWGAKEDVWFHLFEGASPHVVAKIRSQDPQLHLLIAEVGKWIAEKMQLQSPSITLWYTQVKNLKAVSGSPGKVIPKNAKTYLVLL